RGTVLDGDGLARRIDLPNASKNTFNVVLGYEKGPISLRAAGTFRDKYLDEVGDDAETDRTVNQHFQLDLSAKYKLTDNIKIFADWVNVNNAKYFAYQNLAGAKRALQYEEYGSTVKFGARMSF
ncbi:TonB-dependent receptor, partial [Sphingomonas sp. LH128]